MRREGYSSCLVCVGVGVGVCVGLGVGVGVGVGGVGVGVGVGGWVGGCVRARARACVSVCVCVCVSVCLSEHAILAVRAIRSITKDAIVLIHAEPKRRYRSIVLIQSPKREPLISNIIIILGETRLPHNLAKPDCYARSNSLDNCS